MLSLHARYQKYIMLRLVLFFVKMNLAPNVHATIVILLPRGSFRYIFNFNCFRVQTDPPMLSGSDLPSTICAGPVEPGPRARGQFDPPTLPKSGHHLSMFPNGIIHRGCSQPRAALNNATKASPQGVPTFACQSWCLRMNFKS